MMGFTNEEEAKKAKDKSANSYIFTINLHKNLTSNRAREEFGFCLI